MQESFTTEHSSKLFRNSFEQFLNGRGIANKGRSHLQTTRGNVTNCSFNVVGDPLKKCKQTAGYKCGYKNVIYIFVP